MAVIFQIVSTMALELRSFLEALEEIWGVSPNVQLDCEPWGHMDHSCDGHCSCQSSDQTAAYVYELAFTPRESISSSSTGNASTHSTMTDERSCLGPCLGGDDRDRCLLSLIGLVLMAVFSWRCICGGGLAYWCLLIG